MTTGRLEAFSDGVMAIILTIMVLELKVPMGEDLTSLKALIPKLLNYILSFAFVGIYWNNHHHLFQAITKVNGKVLWANLFLLFWLSLLPLTTAWMDEHFRASWPVAIYGFVLLMCSLSFLLIEKAAIKNEDRDSLIATSLSSRKKEIFTISAYVVSIVTAFFAPTISIVIYIISAIVWVIPDRRIEKTLK